MIEGKGENFEPDIYRDNLAEEIKEIPKEKRKEILEKAKENPEYWEARNKKIKARQNEDEIDDGLGVFIKKRTLYHGSVTSGIKGEGKFNKANETTVGEGVYLTSKTQDAVGYARKRARTRGGNPVIYEASVENLKW